MGERKKGYQEFISDLEKRVSKVEQLTSSQLKMLLNKTEQYLAEMGEFTKEELAHISQFVQRDLANFSKQYTESKQAFREGVWYKSLTDSIWHWLAEATDRSQVEWTEVMDDFGHGGHYYAGEMVGFGSLVCTRCGHSKAYYHPEEILPCPECEGEEFEREPLAP